MKRKVRLRKFRTVTPSSKIKKVKKLKMNIQRKLKTKVIQ